MRPQFNRSVHGSALLDVAHHCRRAEHREVDVDVDVVARSLQTDAVDGFAGFVEQRAESRVARSSVRRSSTWACSTARGVQSSCLASETSCRSRAADAWRSLMRWFKVTAWRVISSRAASKSIPSCSRSGRALPIRQTNRRLCRVSSRRCERHNPGRPTPTVVWDRPIG